MMRYNITVGAKTTAGGTVLTGCYFAEIEGKLIACETDTIACPACDSIGKISCVGPRNDETFDGKNSALQDDICLCKCSPPPRLIANQFLKCHQIEARATTRRDNAATSSASEPQRSSAPATPASALTVAAQRSVPPIIPSGQTAIPELIAVAGSQHDNGSGNKMMFIGQAVLELATFKRFRPDRIRTLVVFTPNYNDDMLNDARTSALAYGATFVCVTNVQEFISYLNKGKNRNFSPIEHLSLFCHGVPQQVAFGYELAEAAQMSLNVLNYTQISPAAFSRSAQIDSYACRTGMGNLPEYHIEEAVQLYPQTNESLAQLLANHTRLTVKAFIRRSDYRNTWGSKEERALGKVCDVTGDVVPFKEWCKTRWGALAVERERSEDSHQYTYQKLGAINPVISGDTPALAKGGHHEFFPK
ncbi:MAG: PAAR domain-containing protein [Pseudomonas sp.]